MIVPMKKVSLIIRGEQKRQTLRRLRKLGLLQIEISEGRGERLEKLQEQITLFENTLFVLGKNKKVEQIDADFEKALFIANEVRALVDEKKALHSEKVGFITELTRLKSWGEINPDEIQNLAQKGVDISLYEMPKAEYRALGDSVKTIKIDEQKSIVKFLCVKSGLDGEEEKLASISGYKVDMPRCSTAKMEDKILQLDKRMGEIEEKISSFSPYSTSIKRAIEGLNKEVEFETYATGMTEEDLSEDSHAFTISYFKGFIEAENLDKLKEVAKENAWGLFIEDPVEGDDTPTKLKNNKFVSLIYPLTDFLGTVPGYFEYDISAWFLGFILLFFGIIFGDGGYGLIITAIASIPIIKAKIAKKPISPAFLLIGLFGLSTILWGTLTCTWFGLSPDQLPEWLKALSVPVISNVYADKIWALPWTADGVGLTTAQNLQIFCFTLALIQLSVAHVKCAVRNKKSLKILGDIGSILQLIGIYYLVLSFVVNAEVFSFDLVLGGIPVGSVTIGAIGVGFVLSFVFSNYEGNVIKSLLTSLKNIVSVLLGVVNVFSDIVSYIRLWAVGLAGAAISTTVNELAGPMLGNFAFMIIAIVLLVFGHGLNMILNVLSVIVHGIRLNTLEFSSHLDMAWSGRKFKPFKE